MGNSDILYVNRLSNTVYKDGEILETVYAAKKTDTIKDTIFEIFSRILTRNGEQRKVLYHLMYDIAEYNKNSLSKHLKELYGKSDKTYTRAIDYLISRRIINITKYKVLQMNIDYNLSLLDLDETKSIIILDIMKL